MQFVANVSSLMILKTDPIIIQLFTSIFYVSIYSIPLRIVTYIHTFINQFTDVLSPFIAHLHAVKQNQEIRALFFECSKYAMALSTLFFVLGTIFADRFIILWVGDQFILSILPLRILLGAMWINSTHIVASQILAMSGNHRLLTVYFLVTALFHLILSVILISPYGINGVAVATLLSAFIGLIIYNKRVCDLFDSSYFEYFKAAIAPVILPGIILFLVEIGIRMTIPLTNLFHLIMAAFPGMVLFIAIFWSFSLRDSEKKDFKHLLLSLFKGRAKEKHS